MFVRREAMRLEELLKNASDGVAAFASCIRVTHDESFPDTPLLSRIVRAHEVAVCMVDPVIVPPAIAKADQFQSMYVVEVPILNFGVPESDPSQNHVFVSAYVVFPDRTTPPEDRVIDHAYMRAVASLLDVIEFATI